ncbi:MAG: hypothetical protein KKF62_01980 [Bacteroidetes bacterium]|nr:hypothetical protein [Bacteroidota bacterium]MBU1115333.1 hypothetical protein [Bacteroidota bacterium]MBU1799678.1 hypothetical protein [Bacteroidota bacterium]
MITLLLYILFWFVVYFIEGTHDAYITKETNEHPPAKNSYLANYYKDKWHTWDSYQFAIWHTVIASLLAIAMSCSQFLTLTLSLIFVSVSIRIVAHDLFYDLGMNRSIFTIPTSEGKWDWWDRFISWLDKKCFIHPFYLRFIPLFFSISFHYLFFLSDL